MNETIKTIKNRTSLRKYADKNITDETLNLILESAMRAPTAGNMMLYSIIVIRDEKKKELLSKSCDNQPFIASAPVVLIFAADLQRQYDYFNICNVKDYCKEHGLEYRGPGKSDFMLACCDAMIAAQNSVIAAESLGIGSCYIGDIMENYETHKELLGLSDYTFPIGMLVLGYYEEEVEKIPRPRFDQKYIVFDEKYRALSIEELKEMYSKKEKIVSPENKRKAKNFGQLLYANKTGSDFAAEMDRSINEALKYWDRRKL